MKTWSLIFVCLAIPALATAQILRVPSQYPTIQAGIEAAGPGDTVLVTEGIYYEQISFLGKKPLTVASLFLTDGDTTHVRQTVIDGSLIPDVLNASVVEFISGEDTTSILCGFTIRGGKGTVYTTEGYSFRGGGGISVYNSGAKITKNRITGNHLSDTLPGQPQIVTGAGLEVRWFENSNWVVAEYNTVDHNSTLCGGLEASGAGMMIPCNARIECNVFEGNTCTATGNANALAGGLGCWANKIWPVSLTALVSNNLFEGNSCQSVIGFANTSAVYLNGVLSILSGNEVSGNQVSTNTTVGGGAAILLWAPLEGSVARNNHFAGNTGNLWTGGLHLETDQATPVTAYITVEKNYFTGNASLFGGAFSTIGVPVLLQNNVFTANHSQWGGACYISNIFGFTGPLAVMANNSFHRNVATVGGAIYSRMGKPVIFNSVFCHDSAATQPQEIAAPMAGDTVEMAYCNIGPGLVQGPMIDGGGNIGGDPVFCNPVTLHPEVWSPCVDAGVAQYIPHGGTTAWPAPSTDILGTARPAGAGYDIGAYDDIRGGQGSGEKQAGGLRVVVQPNPFRIETVFSFHQPASGLTEIMIFDSQGRHIATPFSGCREQGDQKVAWIAEALPAGIYFYRLQSGNCHTTGKLMKN